MNIKSFGKGAVIFRQGDAGDCMYDIQSGRVGIFEKANNSINTQIIKALLCYYAVSGDFPIVDSLSIVRKKSG